MSRSLADDLSSYFDETQVRSIEIGLGEKLARCRHPDFDQVVGLVFHKMAEDGELRRQLLSQVDIASAVYQHGKNHAGDL
jgi:hypothetical protein